MILPVVIVKHPPQTKPKKKKRTYIHAQSQSINDSES
jgi:hypothetical protein